MARSRSKLTTLHHLIPSIKQRIQSSKRQIQRDQLPVLLSMLRNRTCSDCNQLTNTNDSKTMREARGILREALARSSFNAGPEARSYTYVDVEKEKSIYLEAVHLLPQIYLIGISVDERREFRQAPLRAPVDEVLSLHDSVSM
jgi:hypothetical protein